MKRNLPIVVKVLNPAISSDAKAVQRFVKAMKTVLPLRHPHLLRVYGAGKTEGYCWVAKEYVRGESLAAVIGRIDVAGHLEWRAVAQVAFRIGKALLFAHSKGIVHQNVTPQNILLGHNVHEAKLTDLMLATALEEDPTQPISKAGVPSESLPYMSPERTDGPGTLLDARTDIYSLGATLFAMLTGKPPFQGTTVAEVIENIRLESAPHFSDYDITAPDGFEKVLRHCMAKRRQDRVPTATELRKQLESFASAGSEAREPLLD